MESVHESKGQVLTLLLIIIILISEAHGKPLGE